MTNTYGVCIAAMNEENNIERAINSCLEQKNISLEQILVVVNGSTDRTAEIVDRLSFIDDRIRLIVSNEKGKAHAWNLLVKESDTDYLFFVDGDVYVPPFSFEKLANELLFNDKFIVASGKIEKLSTEEVALPAQQDKIHGSLYLCDIESLLSRMKSKGYECMPLDTLNDDRFLTYLLDKGEGKIVDGAKVFFKPYKGPIENFMVGIRYSVGDIQLKKIIKAKNLSNYMEGSSNQYSKIELIKGKPIPTIIRLATNYIVMRTFDKVGRAVGHIIYPFIKSSLGGFWISCKNTKSPILDKQIENKLRELKSYNKESITTKF